MARSFRQYNAIHIDTTHFSIVFNKYHQFQQLVLAGEDGKYSKLQLLMMGVLAEFERALANAEIIEERATGATPTELAKEYNISRGNIYRIV